MIGLGINVQQIEHVLQETHHLGHAQATVPPGLICRHRSLVSIGITIGLLRLLPDCNNVVVGAVFCVAQDVESDDPVHCGRGGRCRHTSKRGSNRSRSTHNGRNQRRHHLYKAQLLLVEIPAKKPPDGLILKGRAWEYGKGGVQVLNEVDGILDIGEARSRGPLPGGRDTLEDEPLEGILLLIHIGEEVG